MVYLLAVLMGYIIGTNSIVEKKAKAFVGCGFANPAMGKLSSLGGLGVFFCILPAAYFVGASWGNGFIEGLFFAIAAFGGAFVSGFLQIPGLNYPISAMAIFINIALASVVYSIMS